MQIYTLIYSATGQFLIFTKPLKGYFFKNGAAIYSDGQDLNSGGNSALPGGRVEFLDKSLVAAGRREFIEECGGRFEFRSAPERLCLGQTSLRILNEAGQVFQAMVNSQNVQYAAYYFELGLEYLEALLDLMSRTEPTQGTLVQGVEAAQEIQAGTITNYATIFENYPFCPLDNELESVRMWNVLDGHFDDDINRLAESEETDWYYRIIMNLQDYLRCGGG